MRLSLVNRLNIDDETAMFLLSTASNWSLLKQEKEVRLVMQEASDALSKLQTVTLF